MKKFTKTIAMIFAVLTLVSSIPANATVEQGIEVINVELDGINEHYCYDTEKDGWYHFNPYSNIIGDFFTNDDYYPDDDTQTVPFNSRVYVLDASERASYLNGVKDKETTKYVEDVYKYLDRLSDMKDSGSTVFQTAPCKVVFESNFTCSVYIFDIFVAFIHPIFEGGEYEGFEIDSYGGTYYTSQFYSDGDANMDKNVDMKDVVSIQRNISGLDNKIFMLTADTNNDNKLSMVDVVTLQRNIAGIE